MPWIDGLFLALALGVGFGFIRWAELGLELYFEHIREIDERDQRN